MAVARTSAEGWMGALVLALIGGLVGSRTLEAPSSGRPTGVQSRADASATASSLALKHELVNAHAWEDPIGAARSSKAGAGDSGRGFAVDDQVSYLVLVPVDDDDTADAIETRMGSRQAVSAAMHRLGMAPLRSELQVSRLPSNDGSPALAVGELWEPAATVARTPDFDGRSLVVYVAGRVLGAKEGELVNNLNDVLDRLNPSVGSEVFPELKGILLLRGGSDAFRRDVLEAFDAKPTAAASDRKLVIVNTSSSADLPVLFAKDVSQNLIPRLAAWVNAPTPGAVRSGSHAFAVRRVLGSDKQIFRELVQELRLRGISTGDPRNVIAVLHERNSNWGRAFPQSLMAVIREDLDAREPQSATPDSRRLTNVVPIAYQAALDALPKSAARMTGLERTGAKPPAADQAISPASAGERQLDFVLRSLRQLQSDLRMGEKGRLSAVFIGATDRWDVRPMVQMIKEYFPGVLILTNDLYGQYADPTDYPVMRNVVIGSHLDLSCHPSLQGDLPPFRSCYHTAAFLGTLQGFSELIGQDIIAERIESLAPQTASASRLHLLHMLSGRLIPRGRVYEISRAGASCLGSTANAGTTTEDWILYPEAPAKQLIRLVQGKGGGALVIILGLLGLGLLVVAGLSGQSRTRFPAVLLVWLVVAVSLLAVIVVARASGVPQAGDRLAYFMCVTLAAGIVGSFLAWSWRHDDGAGFLQPSPWKSIHRWGAVSVGLSWFLIAMFVWLVGVGSDSSQGEPFGWGDGISVWCTEFIRVAALLIGLAFLANLISIRAPAPASAGRFGAALFTCDFWRRAIAGFSIIHWNPPVNAAQPPAIDVGRLRAELSDRLSILCRAMRILIIALPFGVVCALLLAEARPGLSIVRGPVARWVDAVVFTTLVFVLNAVVFIVWDAARVYTRFAQNLSAGKSQWPDADVNARAEQTGFDPELVPSLLDVEFIAERTREVNRLIYWPVVMILLALLAVHTRFDGWSLGWPILVLFGLPLLIAVYAALMLRRAAENLRAIELVRLQRQALLPVAPPPPHVPRPPKARHEQAEMLRKTISETRKGAFAPWSEDPLFRAVGVPLIGFASVQLIEWVNSLAGR